MLLGLCEEDEIVRSGYPEVLNISPILCTCTQVHMPEMLHAVSLLSGLAVRAVSCNFCRIGPSIRKTPVLYVSENCSFKGSIF